VRALYWRRGIDGTVGHLRASRQDTAPLCSLLNHATLVARPTARVLQRVAYRRLRLREQARIYMSLALYPMRGTCRRVRVCCSPNYQLDYISDGTAFSFILPYMGRMHIQCIYW